MTGFVCMIWGVIVILLVKEYQEKKEAKKAVEEYMAFDNVSQEEATVEPIDTADDQPAERGGPGVVVEELVDLMQNALLALGCQPRINDDGTMCVAYQGENFHLEFGGAYTRIWDPFWSHIKVNDPEWPKVREAVNIANYSFGPTIVYTSPDSEGIIRFHTRRDILMHPALPDVSGYVRSVLDSFFLAKTNLKNHYQNFKMEQQASTRERRPVGFCDAEGGE